MNGHTSPGEMASPPSLQLYEAGRRSIGLAYVLWFFLGTLGAHRFYLKRSSAWVQLGIFVAGLLLIAFAMWNVGNGTTVDYAGPGYASTSFEWTAVVTGGLLGWLGGLLLSLSWLWWLVDAFLIPLMVRDFNARLVDVIEGRRSFPN